MEALSQSLREKDCERVQTVITLIQELHERYKPPIVCDSFFVCIVTYLCFPLTRSTAAKVAKYKFNKTESEFAIFATTQILSYLEWASDTSPIATDEDWEEWIESM